MFGFMICLILNDWCLSPPPVWPPPSPSPSPSYNQPSSHPSPQCLTFALIWTLDAVFREYFLADN